MIFLFLAILAFILVLLDFGFGCFMTCLMFLFLFLISSFFALTDYPYMLAKKEYVESLESGINNIRYANYESKKDGSLVSGSIENINQSTNLSQYISTCEMQKAEFNKRLIRLQNMRRFKVYWFFMSTNLIDKRINDIEKMR